MKSYKLFFVTMLLSACYHSGGKTTIANKTDIKTMNDSIIQLIINFEQIQDSAALEMALSLNDKVIALDSAKENQFYNLGIRIQLLGLLNKKKEAFLLKEKILSKDKFNIERLTYYGQKYRLMGLIDSSEIYFNSALIQCEKLLKDTLNTDLIMQKVEIYTYQKKKDDALRIIEQALLQDPENIILNTYKDNFDEYCNIINNQFDNIKLE